MPASDPHDSALWLDDARAALAAYDYDTARQLLERGLVRSSGALEAAQPLLELLVDVLGLDADALALEPKLSRTARRDERVRLHLALAAARSGQTSRALVWLEGREEPEVARALIACARQELSSGALERCQALLERARRLDPTEPLLVEIERDLRAERRFGVLLLEEQLDELLTRGELAAAEGIARELLLRDGRNAKAAGVLDNAEAKRAEARARELLQLASAKAPLGADRILRAQQLRAAATPHLSDNLRQELTRVADRLEAQAAEDAVRAKLAELLHAWRAPDTSTAELAERYSKLPEAVRRRAREETGEALFDWIEALGLRTPPHRRLLRALEALRKARALEDQDPAAALALLEPEIEGLRALHPATELRSRLVATLARSRRAAAREALELAEATLRDGIPDRALELLAKLPRGALDEQLRDRAETASTQAERALRRSQMERSVQLHQAHRRPIEARRALKELIESGLLDAESLEPAADLRRALDAEIRQLFAVERLQGPVGAWWRAQVSHSVTHCNALPWVSLSLGLALVPIHAGRWLLLLQLALETGVPVGALLLRLPAELDVAPDVTLRGNELTLVGENGQVLVVDAASGEVQSWSSDHAPPEQIVERGWPSRDPRRLWLELRRRGADPGDESARLVERESGRIVAEFSDGPNTTRVIGHPRADAIVTRRSRPTVVDAAGQAIGWHAPDDCSSALVHPRKDGLIVSSVDYGNSGGLQLCEIGGSQQVRSVEVEEMSGEAQHFIGVSRGDALVAVLGYVEQRELFAYRSTRRGLELLWRRACDARLLLLGDADCEGLYVLHAAPRPERGWLSRLGVERVTSDAEEVAAEANAAAEHGRVSLDAFELWRCTMAEVERDRAGDQPIEGPARNTPSAILDDFVRQHPRDYSGLRRLWARLGRMLEGSASPASDVELARLVEAYPKSGAARMLAAAEHAGEDRWGEARRLLRRLAPGDVAPADARHLCHLQALCHLRARDLDRARGWVEEGLRQEGTCELTDLQHAVEPLPPLEAGSPLWAAPQAARVAPAVQHPILRFRCLLRELDRTLDAEPARVIDHPALHARLAPPTQLLARQAAAWLQLEPDGPEQRARRTLELARFSSALRGLNRTSRELFLPESWSLEELLALKDRARQALGDVDHPSAVTSGEPPAGRPPALPHELLARHLPGFEALLEAALQRWGADPAALPHRYVPEPALLAWGDVRAFLAREIKRHLRSGSSRREARDRARHIHALFAASVSYGLALRKTFWADDSLSAKLRHTELDVRGDLLRVPFACCAFVFTEPTVLSLGRDLVRLDPGWRQTERVAVVTAYLASEDSDAASAPSGGRTLRVYLAVSPWGQPVPWVLARDLRLEPGADLEAILNSHLKDAVERELDPWLGSAALRQLLALTLNTVLYATSAEARQHTLPPLPRRPPGERLVLSGEGVFFLPDKIDIKDELAGTRPPAPLSAGDPSPARSVEHRVAVRGHWRRPPASASDQRLRWVRPHFRGPREAVLVEREYRLREGGGAEEGGGGAQEGGPVSGS